MVHHENSTQSSQYAAAALSPMKFVSAATVAISTNTNNNAVPKMSVDELFRMLLMSEKEQQK